MTCEQDVVPNKKFYQKDWFMYLWLIFFPPIGILILWKFHRTKAIEVKVVLTSAFLVWFVILMASTGGFSQGVQDGVDQASQNQATQPQQEKAQTKPTEASNEVTVRDEAICRILTEQFVENLVGEEYSMFSTSVRSFQFDELHNGTIDVLYLPDGAGVSKTKVDLVIEKQDQTYTIIEYAINGMDLVPAVELPESVVRFTDVP